MILKGSQRSGGKQLAAHLLKVEENEHVDVHDLRGFIAENLPSAFNEIHALSKGTRAKQPFFSLSLSPHQASEYRLRSLGPPLSRLSKSLTWKISPAPLSSMRKKLAVMPMLFGRESTQTR